MEGDFTVKKYNFRGQSKLFLRCIRDGARPLDLTLSKSTTIFAPSGEVQCLADLKKNQLFLVNSTLNEMKGDIYDEGSDEVRVAVTVVRIAFPPQPVTLPTILFDLNYHDRMTVGETQSLSHQLKLSYTSNRNSSSPFNFVLGGDLISPSPLLDALEKQNFSKWGRCSFSMENPEEPWSGLDLTKVVYLCSRSPTALTSIEDDFTYVLGGLVDHTDKPNVAADRASACGIQTARIPLEKFMKMNGRNGSTDITTLAMVQCLLNLRLYNNDWEVAIPATKAFFSAPLRKYVQWREPFEHLNDDENHRSRRPGANFTIT